MGIVFISSAYPFDPAVAAVNHRWNGCCLCSRFRSESESCSRCLGGVRLGSVCLSSRCLGRSLRDEVLRAFCTNSFGNVGQVRLSGPVTLS